MTIRSTTADKLSSVYSTSINNIWLDTLVLPGQEPLVDVVGGPGGYDEATLGARIFASPPNTRALGWIIYIGNDFPEAVEAELSQWAISRTVLKDDSRPCARALQKYSDKTFGPVEFRELTPGFDFHPQDLCGSIQLLSQAFHFLGTPTMCNDWVPAIKKLREDGGNSKKPKIVWEPEPRICYTENYSAISTAAVRVDVVSPNHLELRRMMTAGPHPTPRPSVAEIEKQARKLLDDGVGADGNGIVVVRAAELGCLVVSRSYAAKWFPAFYSPSEKVLERAKLGEEVPSHPSVRDPTGAGNAFLGAFAFEFAKSGDITESTLRGNIAASFTVEQIAFPKLSDRDDGIERWNDTVASERLESYRARR